MENTMTKILLATAMFCALLLAGCIFEPYRGHGYGDGGYQNSRGDRGRGSDFNRGGNADREEWDRDNRR